MISRSYDRAILLVGLLSISAYCTAAGLPLLALLALPAFAIGWRFSIRPQKRLLLPRKIVNILLAGVLAYAVLISLGGVSVEAIAQLVIFILLIKLGDRRGPRDDGQILSLAVFLAIAAMLDDQSLFLGAQLIVLLPLLIGAVMLFQVEAGRNGEGPWRSPGERDRGVLVHPPSHRLWRAAGMTITAAAVGVLVVSTLVFVIMPRGIGESMFGNFSTPRHGAVTGFTEVVKLGAGRMISTSPQVVMEYSIGDEQGVNLGSSTQVYYLRGAVLDDYEEGQWSQSEERPHREPKQQEKLAIALADSPMKLIQKVNVRIRVGRSGWMPLFGVWKPIEAELSRVADCRVFDNATVAEVSAAPPFQYTLKSSPVQGLSETMLLRRTAADFPSQAIRELASQIVLQARLEPDPSQREVPDDLHAARAIQEYLRSNFTYTLEEPALPPGRDAIEHFLFHSKSGHCEYFASAMVAMCRSIGINARMIAGYVAAEYVEGSRTYIVRQSNAHAWVEVEVGRGRWREFDPTPPADLVRIHRPPPTLLGRVRQMLDSVEYAWNTTIVGFSERDRQKLLGYQGDDSYQTLWSLNRFFRRVHNAGPKVVLAAIASGVVVFALVAISGFGLLFMTRQARRLRASWQGRFRAVQGADQPFYRELLAVLKRSGLPKPAWSPPLAHATTLEDVDAAVAAAARELTELYYQTRFGGRSLSKQDQAAALAKVRELRSSLRRPRNR